MRNMIPRGLSREDNSPEVGAMQEHRTFTDNRPLRHQPLFSLREIIGHAVAALLIELVKLLLNL